MKIFDFQQVIHRLLSLQKKKFFHCCSDCSLHNARNLKKNKNFIKLEYISCTITLDCKKKIENATKWWIKKKN